MNRPVRDRFNGMMIIQNCASSKRYLTGEPCHLLQIEDIDTTCGEETDKDKGSKFTFICKQSAPLAFYERAIAYKPVSDPW